MVESDDGLDMGPWLLQQLDGFHSGKQGTQDKQIWCMEGNKFHFVYYVSFHLKLYPLKWH